MIQQLTSRQHFNHLVTWQDLVCNRNKDFQQDKDRSLPRGRRDTAGGEFPSKKSASFSES